MTKGQNYFLLILDLKLPRRLDFFFTHLGCQFVLLIYHVHNFPCFNHHKTNIRYSPNTHGNYIPSENDALVL